MSLEEGPFVFRVNENGSGPNLLIQVCTERGWKEYIENDPIKDGWNLWWKTSAFSVSQHKHLKSWQFTNHIPKGASICRKDNLARNLKCMRKIYGSIYDINPHGYNLPLEYMKFVADCSRRDEEEEESQKVWICKPVGQSQGRGIFLFKSLSDLCYDSNAVVQKYIQNPLLIGGYKFDLRLYVCVPSYHPLTIYLYKEGLVRFSTDKFSMSDLNNPFCHLTNSSLNKLGPGYTEQKDRIGAGCKWSLRQLRQYFQQSGIRDWLLWQRISALVTLTILSQSTSVPQTTNCFEFYGFDVLIDDKLKPWLLEVNLSPALGNDCDVDPFVKKPLLHDLFDLLGLPVCYAGLNLFTIFSPFEKKVQPIHTSASEKSSEIENGNEFENRKSSSTGTKQKGGPGIQSNRTATVKSNSSSAIIAATAASKWRRKRKSHYLFGPPQRVDILKKKPVRDQGKTPLKSYNSIKLISLESVAKPRPEERGEEKKKEITLLSPEERKNLANGKRGRERGKSEKAKGWCGSGEPQNRDKIVQECVQTAKATTPCSENSKILIKIETLLDENKNEKKKKVENPGKRSKPIRFRQGEMKTLSVYEKGLMRHHDNVKPIILPFDKSASGPRGFQGRTKPHSPMLWGNGRDWRNPIHREGDWERIYPINNFSSKYSPIFEEDYQGNKCTVGDQQIRLVVHNVTNFIKVSKQIYFREANATEEELNSRLISQLGMTGDVWLPSK